MSAPTLTGLTSAQADGTACVWCSADFTALDTPQVPVGRSEHGAQVFACIGECCAHVRVFRVAFEPEGLLGSLAELREGFDEALAAEREAGELVGPPVDRVRVDRNLLLLVLAALLVALLAVVAASSAGREPIPMDPGTPASVTTIGGAR